VPHLRSSVSYVGNARLAKASGLGRRVPRLLRLSAKRGLVGTETSAKLPPRTWNASCHTTKLPWNSLALQLRQTAAGARAAQPPRDAAQPCLPGSGAQSWSAHCGHHAGVAERSRSARQVARTAARSRAHQPRLHRVRHGVMSRLQGASKGDPLRGGLPTATKAGGARSVTFERQ
jgi:hypothetical protein